MFKKKLIYGLSLLGAIVGLSIPFETRVVPRWSAKVTDDQGNAIPNVVIEENCYHYSYSEENLCGGSDSSRLTDENGLVQFPERTIRLNGFSRVVFSIKAYLLWFAHGSVGIEAYLIIQSPSQFDSIPPVNFVSDTQPILIVLTRTR